MQIRQVPMNPHPNPNNGLQNVRRDIVRGDRGQQRHQQLHQRLPTNLSEMTYQNKKILIRRQLLLMLHARMCLCEDVMHQRENPNTPRPRCDMPHCGLLKTVLYHMKNCTLGRDCTVVHCSSSRQILSHWKNCANHACPVCPERLKPSNYYPRPNVDDDPTGQRLLSGPDQIGTPDFVRHLNSFKRLLHSEIDILAATFDAVETGESPTVSSTTGEIIPVEE